MEMTADCVSITVVGVQLETDGTHLAALYQCLYSRKVAGRGCALASAWQDYKSVKNERQARAILHLPYVHWHSKHRRLR